MEEPTKEEFENRVAKHISENAESGRAILGAECGRCGSVLPAKKGEKPDRLIVKPCQCESLGRGRND